MFSIWYYIGACMAVIMPWIAIFFLYSMVVKLNLQIALLENGQRGQLNLLNRVINESSENLTAIEQIGRTIDGMGQVVEKVIDNAHVANKTIATIGVKKNNRFRRLNRG